MGFITICDICSEIITRKAVRIEWLSISYGEGKGTKYPEAASGENLVICEGCDKVIRYLLDTRVSKLKRLKKKVIDMLEVKQKKELKKLVKKAKKLVKRKNKK